MVTTKKPGRRALGLAAAACLFLTACGPPGPRALHRGDREVQEGKFGDAIATLSTATNFLAHDATPNPELMARAYNLMGLAWHGAGDFQKAGWSYRQALLADRNFAEADYNLGCLAFEQGNYADARDYMTTFTTQRPASLEGLLKLGAADYHLAIQSSFAVEKTRQFDNAKKALESAQKIRVTPEAYNTLGLIDLQRGPKPAPDAVNNAVKDFKLALASDPQYAAAQLNLSIVYDVYLHDYHNALHSYGQYLLLTPTPPHSAEVIAATNFLDRTTRFQFQTQGHPAEQAAPTPSGGSNTMTYVASKPPAAAPKPAETAGATPPTPAPLPPPAKTPPPSSPATNPTPVAVIQTPEATQPNSPAQPPSSPAPNPPPSAAPSNTQLASLTPDKTPAAWTNPGKEPGAETNTPPAAPPVHKPSKLNPLNWFGSKTKSAAEPERPASRTPVTPLPPPRAADHYAPPAVSLYAGNRAEADRLARAGYLEEQDSRLKEAAASYQEAIKADPGDFEACVSLGVVAIKLKDFGTALEALHHALALQPNSADAHYDYAWALEKKSYYEDASYELEKLVGQHPREVRAHLLLAEIYAQHLGQPELARGHYKKVLETDPKNPQATSIQIWLQENPVR
jgi:tetratricopeptide (TPR) repeat protein